MNTELLMAAYPKLIKSIKGRRPLSQHGCNEERWLRHGHELGIPEQEAVETCFAVELVLEEALKAASRETGINKCPVRAANRALLKLGVPEHMLWSWHGESTTSPQNAVEPVPLLALVDEPEPAPAAAAAASIHQELVVEEIGDHFLYRLYDAAGVLLYVGITDRGPARLVEHYRSKPWFGQVTRVEFERYPTRKICELREEFLIKKLHPRHNVIFNGSAEVA